MANDTLTGHPIPHQSRGETGLLAHVEGTLADFLATQIATLDAVDPALGGFARTARDLVLGGGKRLRPTFAYWGWRGVADPGEPLEPILPAIAALELMHTFALVHDDVMDESATRRGAPTAHRIFAGQHDRDGRRGDADRFGSTSAILLGDLCLVWADQLMARSALTTTTLFAVRARYDRMRVETVAGQYLDVLGETQPEAWSLERALLVARYKTASYTVQRPLQFGLTLSGAEARSEIDAAYARYGARVGEAFQLRDDLLGVYGDPLVTGKPAGDDLRTGKPTALLMLARRLATPAQLAELAISAEVPITRMAEVIADTGAPARVEALIRRRVDEGLAALRAAPIHPDARTALSHLAVAATNRPA
ncbi:polyprenyl synthetase family protein [Actinoplanes sp. NBRC 103695]|uniref:polyprenyl synthetase family protein n=1 Tax=Actinoplanes sp. NBRC 103695 TaxID=3032202 RepID=UPI00255215E8|nr:polyprenyl synthetase family protein [Actinoplanes sp. NBRC 103695]GLY99340.1 putative polyprenyl synthetase [Actinoplanes sp. NBRC 103695]